MGNRTKRRPGRTKPESGAPSIFFIIAMVVGVILLIWMFSRSAVKPIQPPKTTTATSTTRT